MKGSINRDDEQDRYEERRHRRDRRRQKELY